MSEVGKEVESDRNPEISNFLPETLQRSKNLPKLTWRDTLPQIIASCIAYSGVIQAGANMGYSTVLIGGLQLPKGGEIKIDDTQASWIASLVTISLPIGSLLSGPLVDRFGRKAMCISSCVFAILSWILLIAANSVSLIYTARVIAGIAAGMSTSSVVYALEITHPKIRAMVLSLNSVFVSLGILLICSMALFLNWRKIAMVFTALNIAFLFLLFLLPESPYWLICFDNDTSPGRRKRAERNLRWLNRREEICAAETARIDEVRAQRLEGDATTVRRYWSALRSPTVYKPIALLLLILLVQQLSGAYVVIFYAISVFREIGGTFGSGLDEYGALVLLGVIRFVMSVVTAVLSRRIGRRVLCITSGLGMAFSMFFSGMFIYLNSFCDGLESHGGVREQKWMLLVIVLFYVCMSSLGFVVIPWTLIGELLPISFRGVGGGAMVSIGYLIMFAVVKSYPLALKAMGAQKIFFLFSGVSLFGTAVVYLFMPETLGKSLAEIERYFAEPRKPPRTPKV